MKLAFLALVACLCIAINPLAISPLAAQTASTESDPPSEAPEVRQAAPDSTEVKPAPLPVEIRRLPRLIVKITGLAASSGTVEVSLFNSKDTFMVKPVFQESGAPDESGQLEVRFLNVFEGEYGLVVVHDENGNGLYDSGFLGFGAEPVAYSNNARPWLGRPSFDAVKFDLQETMELEINMD